MKKSSLKSSLMLFLAAFIWGVAFVAQSVGMEQNGPFTFNGVRNIIGGIALLPCISLLDRIKAKGEKPGGTAAAVSPWKQKELYIGGICCGLVLFLASSLQQFGIQYTTVGKAGFITAMYIVIVPLLGIFMKKKLGLRLGVSVVLAVAGLYLLCMTEGLKLQKGDFLVLLCALAFSGHILVIDYFSPKTDGVRMACIQFLVCGVLSLIGMAVTETPRIPCILQAAIPILYAGILSSGVAYTLQIVAQKDMNPTVASLIMSLESVFSVLAGWALLGQALSRRELLGCILMFGAIILAQLPQKNGEE